MRFPDLIVIGAAKSGTTTLYHYLCRHPQIFMSTPKEPEFFARDDRYGLGVDWYTSLFSQAKANQVCGEGSTKYTRFPLFRESAPRMFQLLPHAKLIYIMRNPVDQAYSYYVQRIKTAQNTKTQLEVRESFEETIEKEPFFLSMSNYMQQIERYLEFYSRNSFLFLLIEDLIEDTANTLRKVCKFVGVNDQIDLIEANLIAANQAKTHVEWFIRSRTTAPLKKIPGVASAASLFPQSVRDNAYMILEKSPFNKVAKEKHLPPPMLPETRQMLLQKFQEPNQKLAEFLNRDLSHWNQ